MRRFLRPIPLVLVALRGLALFGADISSKSYLDEVRYLASPELKGRATGSPELEKAAQYIAGFFKSFGLKPADGKSFEEAFPVTLGAHDGPGTRFRYRVPDGTRNLTPHAQFTPIGFSSNGKFAGGVVFAGYGVTDKDKNYDDYDGVDVKDKLVLILRHEPNEVPNNPHGLSSHATFAEKAVNAKMHGAKGVILVNDIHAHEPSKENIDRNGFAVDRDKLTPISLGEGPTDAGILFVQVKDEFAEKWIHDEGKDLHDLTDEINKDKKPHSFPMAKLYVDMDVDIRHDVKTVHNVAAYLAGSTDEYVVIGAHYDHLGLGDEHSLAPSQIGTIHPGADDNASGTAGVIELARFFAKDAFSKQPKPKRGILFLTFAGEELGLLGSEWYVNHPALPLEKAVAMINMDMIGRIRDGKVYVSGSGTGSTFPKLLDEVKPPAPIQADITEKTGYGESDHTSFTTKGVPVLFFFSGLHADYHKPSDTADKIDAPDAAKLLDYVADLVGRLAGDADRPKFIRVAEPTQPLSSGPGTGAGSGYGPNFGSIPDFNEPPKGVRFADVRDGTPAAKAGLRAGDILIEFDGKEIGNLYDFTYALRAHKAGDLVLVKVLRGTQTIEASVLLTERR
jgi:Peptidase family M28/PDZ domain/PA domain